MVMGKHSKLQTLLLALSDILLINFGIATAFVMRFGFDLPDYNLEPYLNLVPWLSIITLIVFYMFDLYASWRRKNIYNLIYAVVISVLTLMMITMALAFWYRGFAFPRSVLVITVAVQIAFLTTSRSLFWIIDKRLHGRKKVLIIADQLNSEIAVADKFSEHDKGWFDVAEVISGTELRLLDSKLKQIDVVVINSSLREKISVIAKCAEAGKEVLIIPELYELFILSSEPQQVSDMPVLSIQPPKLSSSQALLKRTFDLSISLATLILLSPVLLLLYIIIPLTSSGPALFKQERVGKNGKPYNMLKFRSMVQDAERKTGPVLACESDPRITKVGRLIRATRLDELPQLVNVLKGEMSLVGPRPERQFFIDKFKVSMPHYAYRLAVKPGITGLAQVMAKYNTSVEDKLRFDLMYIKNYSLDQDIKILLHTIRVVLQREQAMGVKRPVKRIKHVKKLSS
jgi:exopolysaccharide biosynthesis polyprenyl glycosylphosphotransferase